MPTYEYVCKKCEQHFDVFQKMTDPRLEDCVDETCDGTMKRLIGTGAGIIFKGSGFYQTDYRSESYKAGAKGDSSSSSGGDSTKKSESKSSSSDSSSPSKPSKPSSSSD